MTLRTNDKAPGCIASTAEGTINFREGIGDGWCIGFFPANSPNSVAYPGADPDNRPPNEYNT